MIPVIRNLIRGSWQMAKHERQVFALCLLSAAAYWAVVALQQPGKTELNAWLSIGQSNTNDQKPVRVSLVTEGSVFRLALIELKCRFYPLKFDLNSPWSDQTPLTLQPDLLHWAKKQRISIVSTQPERLSPEHRIAEKRVPLIYNVDVVYAPGWGPIQGGITPQTDSVTLIGQAAMIDTISKLTTNPVQIVVDGEYQTSVTTLQALPIGASTKEKISNIPIVVHSQRYTEASTMVAVQLGPKGSKARAFPSEVEVRYSVPLSRYGKIAKSDIKVIADASIGVSVVPTQVVLNNENAINAHTFPPLVRIVLF